MVLPRTIFMKILSYQGSFSQSRNKLKALGKCGEYQSYQVDDLQILSNLYHDVSISQ